MPSTPIFNTFNFVTGSPPIIMFSKSQLVSVLFALAAASSVAAHGALVAISGDNGVTAQGFGVVESTPRDGTNRNPFQVSRVPRLETQ